MRLKFYGILILTLLMEVGNAFAAANESFRIIVHLDNPATSIERRKLAEIFLKNSTYWPDNQVIRPVDLNPDSSVRQVFSQSVLSRSVSLVRIYWQQRIFTGRGVPPPELASDAEVIEYVRNHRGAIGYISNKTTPRNVRTLAVN